MPRPGFHQLNAIIPTACWAAILAEADSKRRSASEVVTFILCKHFKMDLAALPPRARQGRPPRRPPEAK